MSQVFHPTAEVPARTLTLLLGLTVGVIAANLYYAQPLVAMISKALGIATSSAGLVVTFTQVGYGLGVLLLVPLADLLENKKLIITLMMVAVIALLGLAFSTSVIPYFTAAFILGIGTSAVQIVVPYAAHMTSESHRGRVVGSLMSGLMLGIMLSRPISSLLTDLLSWHAVFFLSAAFMTAMAFILYKFLPPRKPEHTENIRYGKLIASMGELFVTTPVLRRRAIYQAFMFGAFCLFWTSAPLYLMSETYHLSQTAIAIFAFAGVAGAISAPFAGRLADKGMSTSATIVAMLAAIASFAVTHILEPGSYVALGVLVFAAILLDAGITATLVLGQRAIFSLKPEYRGRLNGLYIATIFVGGAAGSYAGAWAYAHGGWMMTTIVGALFPATALIYFFTEWLTGFRKSQK
ncbi:MFS transporter [Bdellovibrio sp. SKB1291214]|uniref:MFS transporter n=1 Tax=Bdellovibrio sp. SKB1291214 TaxID=1732569 RepID=UPI000B519A88|nr:MFS transporter [Bdellovibrio sp. SKB1291214]UYL07808.1 MFS transporter [Bdellovibrio sp. SKB1291214]